MFVPWANSNSVLIWNLWAWNAGYIWSALIRQILFWKRSLDNLVAILDLIQAALFETVSSPPFKLILLKQRVYKSSKLLEIVFAVNSVTNGTWDLFTTLYAMHACRVNTIHLRINYNISHFWTCNFQAMAFQHFSTMDLRSHNLTGIIFCEVLSNLCDRFEKILSLSFCRFLLSSDINCIEKWFHFKNIHVHWSAYLIPLVKFYSNPYAYFIALDLTIQCALRNRKRRVGRIKLCSISISWHMLFIMQPLHITHMTVTYTLIYRLIQTLTWWTSVKKAHLKKEKNRR